MINEKTQIRNGVYDSGYVRDADLKRYKVDKGKAKDGEKVRFVIESDFTIRVLTKGEK